MTLDSRERLDVARQLIRHISEQLPAMGLLYRIDLMLIADRLANVSAQTVSQNAHDWDVR